MSIAYFKLIVSLDFGCAELPEQSFHSAMRGVFGRVLKGTFCIQKRLDCSGCPMQNCLYKSIFEPDPSGFENFKPYIIRHVRSINGIIDVEYLFFGNSIKYSSSILHCILKMQDYPLLIKGERHPIRILKVVDGKNNLLYSENQDSIAQPQIMALRFLPMQAECLTVQFITPLRMKHEGRLMQDFSWDGFFRGLYFRVSYLDRVYNEGRLALPDIWQDSPIINHDFTWQEMYRRSFRQSQSMSLGGLIGVLQVSNPQPETVALLRLGSILQAGKQCTFGLGKYRLSRNQILHKTNKEAV
jgi:hypothetical protein